MPQDNISVVMCTYNRAASLRRSLPTILAQEAPDFDFEVVIVDDQSADDTRAAVEEAAAAARRPVRYAYLEGRRGIAVARNRGITEASGNWIVFFDDDQIAEPDLLANLLRVAREKEAVCVGGSRRLDLPEAALAGLGPVCRGLLGENIYAPPPSVLSGKELPSTGNLMIARAVFDEAGMFDPRFSGSEDSEFLNRVRDHGHAIWTAPDAMCSHMIPQYRTTEGYFRWVSLRWGNGFAKIDLKQHGAALTVLLCLARVAQAFALNMPRLVLARLRGARAAALDRHTLLWRAQGYARTVLWLLAPRLFPQRRFIAELEFRMEREIFGGKER